MNILYMSVCIKQRERIIILILLIFEENNI